MFAKRNDSNKQRNGNDSAPQATGSQYPLEAIIALQKSLEHGMEARIFHSHVVEVKPLPVQRNDSAARGHVGRTWIATSRRWRELIAAFLTGIAVTRKKSGQSV
jgi:hypothetical protein